MTKINVHVQSMNDHAKVAATIKLMLGIGESSFVIVNNTATEDKHTNTFGRNLL